MTSPPEPEPVPAPPIPVEDTGLQASREERKASAEKLASPTVKKVREERFSWLNRKVLIQSRNDQFAKMIFDPVPDQRSRWIEAQRAAGVKPDLVVDRKEIDVGSFLIVGDTGEGDASQTAVARALRTMPETEFMLILSDVIYPAGDINDYPRKFYAPYGFYENEIYALPGNHDWYDGLDGFMFNFCGAEALPAVEYRASSYPGRERLGQSLWRKSSRPERDKLLAARATRPPWNAGAGQRAQPAPYFALELEHLVLVSIDTGILGTIDLQQGQWLLRVSSANPKPKILLTGKPLVVDGRHHPCGIEGKDGVALPKTPERPEPKQYRDVDSIVREDDFNYVATIGGDIHNYQRYPLPAGEDEHGNARARQYIVSGGGGAYMSATHPVPPAPELTLSLDDDPATPPEPAGITEADTKLYPLRGDSLALYSLELLNRGLKGLGLLAGLAPVLGFMAYVMFRSGGWGLGPGAALTAIVGAAQFLYSLGTDREKAGRFRCYSFTLLALAAGMWWLSETEPLSAGDTKLLLAAVMVVLPLFVLAVGGWSVHRFALLVSFLLGLSLVSRLITEDEFEGGVRVFCWALVVLIAAVLVALPRKIREERARRAAKPKVQAGTTKEKAPLAAVIIALALVGAAGVTLLIGGLLRWDFSQMAGWVATALGGLILLYVLWLRIDVLMRPDVRHRFEELRNSNQLPDHAGKYMADRLGLEATRPEAQNLVVDGKLKALFAVVYPTYRLKRTMSPMHVFLSEILDRNEPPFAKSFLKMDIAANGAGRELTITCFGVTGLNDESVKAKGPEDAVQAPPFIVDTIGPMPLVSRGTKPPSAPG